MSLEVKVKQYTFYTITAEDNSSSGYYVGGCLCDFGKKINLPLSDDKKEVIIPNPIRNGDEYIFSTNLGFFNLANSYCQTTILNSHSESQDNGLFFIGAYSMYDGKKEKIVNEYPSHEDLVELGSSIYDMVADKLLPQIAEVISNINMAFTIAKGVDTLFSLFSNDEVTENVEFNNEEALKKLELFYTNKDAQLQNYNQLIKSYVYAEPDLKLINNGQYVKYNFRYSYDSRDRLDSKIIQTIGFDLYYKGEYVDDFSNNIEKEVETDYTENMSLDKVYTGYSLQNIKNTYVFVPQNTQKYILNVSNDCTYIVLDSKGNMVNVLTDELQYGAKYYISIKPKYAMQYSISIEYPPIIDSVTIPAKSSYYFKLSTSSSGTYVLDNFNDINSIAYINDYRTKIFFIKAYEYKTIQLYNGNSVEKEYNAYVNNISNSKEWITYYVNETGKYTIDSALSYYYIKNGSVISSNNNYQIFDKDTLVCFNEIDSVIQKSDYQYKIEINGVMYNEGDTCDSLVYGEVIESYQLYILENNDLKTTDCEIYEFIPNGKNKLVIMGEYIIKNKTIFQIEIRDPNDNFKLYISPSSGTIETQCIINNDNLTLDLNTDYSSGINLFYTIEGITNVKNEIIINRIESAKIQFNRFEIAKAVESYTAKINYYLSLEHFNTSKIDEMIFVKGENVELIPEIDCTDYSKVNSNNEEYINIILKTIKWKNGNYYIFNEVQFLAILYVFEKDYWISFDDGLNSDSYIIGDAMIKSYILTRDLDFNGYTIVDMPSNIYLYGCIRGFEDEDASGYRYIKNLNFTNYYLYLENYGYISNIAFENTNLKGLFEYGTTYGTCKFVMVNGGTI